MRAAILSDTHDNKANTEAALKMIRDAGVGTILHCGDMAFPSTAELFKDFRIHYVRGNNEFDLLFDAIEMEIFGCRPGSTTSEDYYEDVFDGKRFAMLHGHDAPLFYELLDSGNYDYIFHGHTHRRGEDTDGKTRIICPGSVSRSRLGKCGFCILDFETGVLDWYEIE